MATLVIHARGDFGGIGQIAQHLQIGYRTSGSDRASFMRVWRLRLGPLADNWSGQDVGFLFACSHENEDF